MSEVSGAVKQFTISINQQFPDGTLFLLLSDQDLKKFLMEMSSKMLEDNSPSCRKHTDRIIGRNQIGGEPFWVFSETVQISGSGILIENDDESPFLWLQHLINGSNVLLQESLKCAVSTPLDNGQSITNLCLAIRAFMPENVVAAMATISAVVMGSNYTYILKMFGCCGVPILTGPPGSCKSEATKCALSPFGAHESLATTRRLLIFSRQLAKQPSQFMLTTSVKSQLMHGRSFLSMHTMALEEVLAHMA